LYYYSLLHKGGMQAKTIGKQVPDEHIWAQERYEWGVEKAL
jgi:hypothetical protein